MNAPLPYDASRLRALAAEIVGASRALAARGWVPATSGNFSCRLDGRHVAITASGRDKSALVEADVMVVDRDGRAVGSALRPSAETPLHTQLYQRFPGIGCVLHTHSPIQTVASRLFAEAGAVRLEGYELLKAFSGITTHEAALDVPVVSNGQDMPALAAAIEARLDRHGWGYLIAGHGLYAWGGDMAEALRHLEAFDFLLGCELELRRLGGLRSKA